MQVAGIDTDLYAMLAPSNWALFTSTSVGSTTTTTPGGMAEDPADTTSEAGVPQDHLDHPSGQPDTTTANEMAEDLTNTTSKSDVLPNHPDHVPSQQDIPPTQSSRMPD